MLFVLIENNTDVTQRRWGLESRSQYPTLIFTNDKALKPGFEVNYNNYPHVQQQR